MTLATGVRTSAGLVDQAYAVLDRDQSIEATVYDLRDVLADQGPVSHLVYHSSRIGAGPNVEPFIQPTYPADWIKRYVAKAYMNMDPIGREGFKRTLPFDWSELELTTSDEVMFMRDAARHGAGCNGLTIPVRSRYGHRGLVSLASDAPIDRWQGWWRSSIGELTQVAHRLHRKSLGATKATERAIIAPRGVECLAWISRGKTMAETGLILNLTENTVRAYLRTARERLGVANTTDAVRRAIEQGIIEPNA